MRSLLIVEDDIEYSFELKQLFMPTYEVDEAVDGLTALAKIHAKLYEVVILDVEILGQINGLQILKTIKNDKRTEKTLVIVLTNLGPERKDEFLNQGANQYLMKSETSLPDLKVIVDRLTSSGIQDPQ